MRSMLEIAFDYLCMNYRSKDPEFSRALVWINNRAFKEGLTTYQFVNKILGMNTAKNNLSSI